MDTMKGYMAGCNLGHWISQYGPKREEHWDHYITEPDFARMAEWGMDHVRLPVDYFIFERDEEPGVYLESGLQYIDNTIQWASRHNLNVVLDLHHAPGFFFGNGDKNNLFSNRESQLRFIHIWEFFAARYSGEGDSLRFELLNELVWENSDPWNALWQETAAAIHAVAPDRKIIIGGNRWNSVYELKNLHISDNPKILYTFHMYDPFLFSHQRAGWIPDHVNYKKPVTYPYLFDDHCEYYKDNVPANMGPGIMIDKNYLRKVFEPAAEFIRTNNRPLYLGEYGAISHADDDSAVRWYNDVADLCLEYGIGRAVWSYRGFANITNADNQVHDIRMIRAISRK